MAGAGMRRFTLTKPRESAPSFEGVVFNDGRVVANNMRSGIISIYEDIDDVQSLFGHPEYGAKWQWLDDDPNPPAAAALMQVVER